MIDLTWKGKMAFEAKNEGGEAFVMNGDKAPDPGLEGPSPMQTLLAAIAGCMAFDVISILEKKRQKVTSYKVQIEGDRPPEGVYPRPFTAIRIKHILEGEAIDEAAVQRAIELSEEKYCSVSATLRQSPSIDNEWEIR
ncbi:MAG: hypothetical protein A2139_03720 [Desulfobacca sp. RBG_16_60_12]|nr:MAG: hypothetical protein A2139_03720 [Desulfobacca sp. RBG_16_60_12]